MQDHAGEPVENDIGRMHAVDNGLGTGSLNGGAGRRSERRLRMSAICQLPSPTLDSLRRTPGHKMAPAAAKLSDENIHDANRGRECAQV